MHQRENVSTPQLITEKDLLTWKTETKVNYLYTQIFGSLKHSEIICWNVLDNQLT